MRKIFLTLIISIQFLCLQTAKAQIPPVSDSAWVKQTALCEGFDSLGLRTSKWEIFDYINTSWEPSREQTAFISGNVTFTGSTMKIKVDTLVPYKTIGGTKYYYQGGQIQANDTSSYKYGYLEY